MTTTPKNLKGTRTEKNIVEAYMSESTAYTRYTYYAQQAQKESYFPVQKIFEETADNELHHGKVFLKMLQGGTVDGTITVDAIASQDTASNLEIAIHEELDEAVKSYLAAAKVAEEEGFPEIAEHFRSIAKIEDQHRRRFLYYLKQVEDGTVWKRDHEITWKCLVCGYEFKGTEPPMECPACDHPREHYMAMDYPEGLE